MSIILKALKKIQEQQERRRSVDPADESGAAERAVVDFAASPTTPRASDDGIESPHASPGDAAASDKGVERITQSRIDAYRLTPRQRFATGPRALLILLVCLGVFITGWFASRIYINVRPAPDPAAREAPPKVAMQAKGIETAGEPAPPSEQVAPDAAQATSPGEPIARETVQAPPASTEKAAPAASTAPPPESVVPAAPPVEPAQTPPPVKEAQPAEKTRPKFKINAIAWQNSEPRAIVNMQSVYEGDVIEGATVLAIKRKIIVFEYEGETFEVRF